MRKIILIITGSLFCLCILFYFIVPKAVQTNSYSFFSPWNIEIRTSDFNDYTDSVFFYSDDVVGGVQYYSSIDKDFLIQQIENPDFDIESFLIQASFLSPDDSFDAHMIEFSKNEPSINLWEIRDGIERNHYLFFSETGACYDLWFFCDEVADSTIQKIKNSFQLEELE